MVNATKNNSKYYDAFSSILIHFQNQMQLTFCHKQFSYISKSRTFKCLSRNIDKSNQNENPEKKSINGENL